MERNIAKSLKSNLHVLETKWKSKGIIELDDKRVDWINARKLKGIWFILHINSKNRLSLRETQQETIIVVYGPSDDKKKVLETWTC